MIKIDELVPLLKPGFVAHDCCGWCWYSCQPRFSNGCWQRICDIVRLSDCFDIAPFAGDWKDSLIEIKPRGKKPSEWHISDCIKTDEDVYNLLEAERGPYEKALRTALATLQVLATYPEDEKLNYYGGLNDMYSMSKDMADLARRACERVVADLKKKGIPDPTELKAVA